MSGAMRRIGEYLGLLEDTGRYDEFDDYDEVDAEPTQRQKRVPEESLETVPVQSARARRREATVADLDERRRSAPAAPRPSGAHPAGPRPAATVAGLSTITTLHPRTYNEARIVGENFRDGVPVIMNLTEMDDDDAKRLVDFAAGLVFATRGTIERVTNKVFLLSPPNVSVAAEDKQRIAEGGFFNQS